MVRVSIKKIFILNRGVGLGALTQIEKKILMILLSRITSLFNHWLSAKNQVLSSCVKLMSKIVILCSGILYVLHDSADCAGEGVVLRTSSQKAYGNHFTVWALACRRAMRGDSVCKFVCLEPEKIVFNQLANGCYWVIGLD